MFIYGLRDAFGLKITVWLFSIWNVYFFIAVYAGIAWLSLLLTAFSIVATCYASFLLCRHRKDLVFSSKSSKEHAFPSSRRIAQLSFNMHVLPFFLFLLLVPAMLSVPTVPELGEKTGLIFVVYQVCFVGVVGLLHHLVHMILDRKAKKVIDLDLPPGSSLAVM